ncbi:MAG TPA: hypothetical protein VFO79_12300 [Xanthomonadales bacterium]|nr:hypothetical protein [Xanthomonadales bacterium]
MSDIVNEQWWLGDPEPGVLVWARLRVDEDGRAEVFDATGLRLHFDDEDFARSHLLDHGYRAYDGLDDDDAAGMGFDLAEVGPPAAEDEEELVTLMTQKLGAWTRN